MVNSKLTCNTAVDLDFDVEAELLQEGLGWGFESEACARCEGVHEEDVLEL